MFSLCSAQPSGAGECSEWIVYSQSAIRDPRPRPDLVLHERGDPSLVVDAKYRDILAKGLPRDILYQLSVYALAWSAGDGSVPALAICPSLSAPDEAWLTVQPPGGAAHHVGVRTVDWSAALEAVRSGDDSQATQLAAAWTQPLH